MDAYEAIKEEWKKIPSFQCKSGCHDCCGVILMSRVEWENIPDIGGYVKAKHPPDLTCRFLGIKDCRIYENRPTICRLFGAVDAVFLTCPHGCAPTFKLTNEQGREISRTVERIGV